MSGVPAGWVVIGAGALLTYAIRAVFLLFAGRLTAVPPLVREGLRMIPAAALAALVAPAVLRPEGELVLLGPRPIAAILAAVVAWRTRNVAVTIVVGMATVIALAYLPGR
ncbi:MAG: AzlD domain-containing protein [Actinobacteria bacterium]|nr:AzlD domain-containing protein [Actinomycetota bacterium]